MGQERGRPGEGWAKEAGQERVRLARARGHVGCTSQLARCRRECESVPGAASDSDDLKVLLALADHLEGRGARGGVSGMRHAVILRAMSRW